MVMRTSVRDYRLYRFWGHDGALLYVGITGRVPWRRLLEHVAEKPWADEMACWEVDRRVWGSEAEVLAAEKQAIYDECPRYNVEHNGNNPHRVVVRQQVRGSSRLPVSRRRAWWVTPVWWAGLWLAGSLALGVFFVQYEMPADDAVWAAPTVSGGALLAVWRRWFRRRRRRLRRRRR